MWIGNLNWRALFEKTLWNTAKKDIKCQFWGFLKKTLKNIILKQCWRAGGIWWGDWMCCVTGRVHRLRCSPAVGNMGRPGAAELSGHPWHARGQPELVREPGTIWPRWRQRQSTGRCQRRGWRWRWICWLWVVSHVAMTTIPHAEPR